MTCAHCFDAAPDEATKQHDAAIIGRQVFQRMNVDRALTQLRFMIARQPLPFALGTLIGLAEDFQVAAFLKGQRLVFQYMADEKRHRVIIIHRQ